MLLSANKEKTGCVRLAFLAFGFANLTTTVHCLAASPSLHTTPHACRLCALTSAPLSELQIYPVEKSNKKCKSQIENLIFYIFYLTFEQETSIITLQRPLAKAKNWLLKALTNPLPRYGSSYRRTHSIIAQTMGIRSIHLRFTLIRRCASKSMPIAFSPPLGRFLKAQQLATVVPSLLLII